MPQDRVYRTWTCPKCAATFQVNETYYRIKGKTFWGGSPRPANKKARARASAAAAKRRTQRKLKHKRLGCRRDGRDERESDLCFLTTSCVRSLGLPDDCNELTVLRSLRDEFLPSTAGGPGLVETYYRIAPRVVAEIERTADPEAEWARIHHELVAKCVNLAESGQPSEAVDHYVAYVSGLMLRFCISAEQGALGPHHPKGA